jgi:ATP-binding cassette subfamily B protein
VDALLFPVIWLLIGFSMLLALIVGGREVQAGRITPGVIAEFIVYVNMLTWPVASVGWVSSVVQQALVSFRRICEFLDTQPAILSGSEPAPLDIEEIEFDNVHFTFPDTGVQALRGVSFRIRKGECLGITGRTGAGKTAILQLIMRFYDPDNGVIRVNGRDIRAYDLRSYRNLFGYVPQEAMLFSDTVEGNILWGRRGEEGHPEVVEAARQAAVAEAVKALPQGFDTPVGERGVRLSGGQKQRLALARAILKKPPVLLLDDSLSAVDYETEKIILDELDKIRKEIILIMTSHRVTTFPGDATILVLHHGVISETGPREQLLQSNGYFAEVFKEQKQL